MPDAHDVVVIGGGFIGLEAASQPAEDGQECHRCSNTAPAWSAAPSAKRPSEYFLRRTRERGLDILLNARVARLVRRTATGTRVAGVELEDGTVLPAQIVLVGIGVDPQHRAGRAARADGGQRHRRRRFALASDGTTVAVGDCANMPNPVPGAPGRTHPAGERQQRDRARQSRGLLADRPARGIRRHPVVLVQPGRPQTADRRAVATATTGPWCGATTNAASSASSTTAGPGHRRGLRQRPAGLHGGQERPGQGPEHPRRRRRRPRHPLKTIITDSNRTADPPPKEHYDPPASKTPDSHAARGVRRKPRRMPMTLARAPSPPRTRSGRSRAHRSGRHIADLRSPAPLEDLDGLWKAVVHGDPHPRQRHPPADLAGLRRTALRAYPDADARTGAGRHPAARHRLGPSSTNPASSPRASAVTGARPRSASSTRLQGCDVARRVLPPPGLLRGIRRAGLRDHRRPRHPPGGVLAGGRAGARRRPAVALRPRRDRAGLRLVRAWTRPPTPTGSRPRSSPSSSPQAARRDGHGRPGPLHGPAQDGR